MKKEKSVLVADYKRRVIWFHGTITLMAAEKFGRIMKRLNNDGTDDIIFYIRGPGGDPWATFTMMNDISNSDSPVFCVAHKNVASGCFTLTQAGSGRAALPGTKFLFHSAVATFNGQKFNFEKTQAELREYLQRLELIDAIQFLWFTARGRPVELIHDFLKTDKVLSLPMAKKFQLIDAAYSRKRFLKDRKKMKKIIRKQNKKLTA